MIKTLGNNIVNAFTGGNPVKAIYAYGEKVWPVTIESSYYIKWTPSKATGTMWIKSTSDAGPVSYQISSYRGMLNFGNSYPEYLSFESCNWRRIETNIPMFNESHTFAICSTLQNADLYNCTSLFSYTFYHCNSLSQVSLPICEYIGYAVFSTCDSLSKVSLPMCSYIGTNAFKYCYSLSYISLPVCTYIGDVAFFACSSLSQVSLPVCTYIGNEAFGFCSSLNQVNLPMCSSIDNGAFFKCNKLSQVSLPVCTYISGEAFRLCMSLSQISLPMCSYIGSYAFLDCTSLSRITIGYSSVCSLYSTNVFDGTQITSSIGSIYVPASLVDAYKSAPYWSYFSAIIQSYPGL